MRSKAVLLPVYIILILSIITACAAPASAPPTASEILDLGERYLLELDYEQAVAQFLAVIEIEPMNARAYIGAAEAYLALGRTDDAIAVLERGLAETGDVGISAMLAGLSVETAPTIEPFVEDVDLPEDSPMPYSDKVTVVGVIIDNTVEYEDQWYAYMDIYEEYYEYPHEYAGAKRHSVAINNYGIRFSESVNVLIDDEMVAINEVAWVEENMMPSVLAGEQIVATGFFRPASYIYWRKMRQVESDLYIETDNGTRRIYIYAPNGEFSFVVESYSVVG